MAVRLAMLPPEVSVPAALSGRPIARAIQAASAFSSRAAPGAAGAKPEYLLAAAARNVAHEARRGGGDSGRVDASAEESERLGGVAARLRKFGIERRREGLL